MESRTRDSRSRPRSRTRLSRPRPRTRILEDEELSSRTATLVSVSVRVIESRLDSVQVVYIVFAVNAIDNNIINGIRDLA